MVGLGAHFADDQWKLATYGEVWITTRLHLTRSAYCNRNVYVSIVHNQQQPNAEKDTLGRSTIFERSVWLQIEVEEGNSPRPFGTAWSVVHVSDPAYLPFFAEDTVYGLGQFFQAQQLRPLFKLLGTGRRWKTSDPPHTFLSADAFQRFADPHILKWLEATGDKCIWRSYELESKGIKCQIIEVLDAEMLNRIEKS